MGNPTSPTLANLVMYDLITSSLKKLPFPVKFINLYVDDTFLINPKNSQNIVLRTFNSYHQKLQFTMEIERNNSLAFLDTLVIRDNDNIQLISNLYMKPTNVNRTVNYDSNHTFKQKINIIKNFAFRIFKLSNESFHEDNIKKVIQILKNNNYPTKLCNEVIRSHISQQKRRLLLHDNLPKADIKYAKFPQIPQITNSINKSIKNTNVKLAPYNTLTVNKLYTKLKDRIPISKKSSIVYNIPCGNCPKLYIGQTKQYFTERIKQHKYDCKITNQHRKEQTALAKHHFECLHNFDFESSKLLDSEQNYYKRNLSEMIYIKCTENVSFKTDVDYLNRAYSGLLQWLKVKLKLRQ